MLGNCQGAESRLYYISVAFVASVMTTNTRSEILALLKRNGGNTVADLASSLGLAPITVRQHLTRLERDGLLAAEQRNGSVGRPHLFFRLTAKAHAAAFPRRSDRLVELLVREISHLDGSELGSLSEADRTRLVLRRLAERLADEYIPFLERWPLHERVVFVTEVLHTDGGFAEWERNASGYEVRDYNCIFHRLSQNGQGDGACEWHQTFLSRTLGTEVRSSPCEDQPAHCCRYLVLETTG
jgi:predicted ArsR family transcriptional regulator